MERVDHAAPNRVLHLKHAVPLEVLVLRQNDPLRRGIEQLNRDAPPRADRLDVSLQDVAHAEIAAGAGGVAAGSVLEDRRRRQHGDIFEAPEDGDQRIGEPQRQRRRRLGLAQEKKWQHGNGGEVRAVRRAGRERAGEGSGELGGGRKAVRRHLGQCPSHGLLQRGRHDRPRRAQWGHRIERMARDHLPRRRAQERRVSGEHLVGNAAETVEVAATVEVRIRRCLLGTHVARRPHRDPRLGQAVPLRSGNRPTDAKIHDQCVSAAQQDVFWLDVAVDDVVAVGVAQRVGDFADDRDRLVERELPLAEQPGPQRLALHERHGVIEGAAGLTAVVQRHDMRMVQARGDGNLPQESLGAECGSELGVEDLERDGAIVLHVAGEEDGPIPPAPDLTLDTVAVGQRRFEVVQQFGDQTAPAKVPPTLEQGRLNS